MNYLIKSFTNILKNKGILDIGTNYSFDEIKIKRIRNIKVFFIRKMYREISTIEPCNKQLDCMNSSIFTIITKETTLPTHYRYIYRMYKYSNVSKDKITANKKVLDLLFESLNKTEKIAAFCLAKRIQGSDKSPIYKIEIYTELS